MDLCSIDSRLLFYPWVLLEKAIPPYSSMLSHFFLCISSLSLWRQVSRSRWTFWSSLDSTIQRLIFFFFHLLIQSFSGSLFSLLILKSGRHCLTLTGSFHLLMALLSCNFLRMFLLNDRSYLAFVTVSVFTPAENNRALMLDSLLLQSSLLILYLWVYVCCHSATSNKKIYICHITLACYSSSSYSKKTKQTCAFTGFD